MFFYLLMEGDYFVVLYGLLVMTVIFFLYLFMEEKTYYVYMMTNKWHTVIYTGATSDLEGRVWQHKNKADPMSFTAKYNCNKLVWYAETDDVYIALEEEKRIKAGSRAKKIQMIEEMNPDWKDLAEQWFND